MGRRISEINPSTMRGPGDFGPPEPPEPVEGRAEEVMRYTTTAALAVEHWYRDGDGDLIDPLPDDAGDALADLTSKVERGVCSPAVLCRMVPVAVVGMQEGWEAPVVVRLPDPGEAERVALRAEVGALSSDLDLSRAEARRWQADAVALRAEVARLRAGMSDIIDGEGENHPICEHLAWLLGEVSDG